MMKRGIALGLLTLISHCAFGQENWRDPTFIERAFLNVALRNEYSAGEKPLSKWREPLRIYFDHQVPDKALHEQLARDHVQHLAQVTGHSIQVVTSRTEANVIWVFTQQSKWQQALEELAGKSATQTIHGAICQANYSTNSASEIVAASVVIPVDQARDHGKLLACIVEEITQVMGLPNDSELANPSIFNDRTPEDLLSPLDVVLLWLLYEPDVTTGMNQHQVQSVIRTKIKQYQQQGRLKKAVQEAHSSPLYEWLR
ncbi:DUF2927 domain-containing protein [Vibrio cholerae]|nr:DUF2927 domain-containing protein [Vibrio cholerae]EGQ9331586.1 DUF2927 domain-containing protein [Vibrio cholerae]EIA3089882.1 DUF2927 domain-containing protein [Vibrio cholerae]EJL6321102.1 DUF2927 domain-containing protein [Vibrio cholerae]EJL7022871.1 DUF2927 domain-containing protein [Vibrio cholerae]